VIASEAIPEGPHPRRPPSFPYPARLALGWTAAPIPILGLPPYHIVKLAATLYRCQSFLPPLTFSFLKGKAIKRMHEIFGLSCHTLTPCLFLKKISTVLIASNLRTLQSETPRGRI